MSANNVDRTLAVRVRTLEALVDNLQRRRSGSMPNVRDLRDADLTKVKNGQVAVYSSATGRWAPGPAERAVFNQRTVAAAVSDVYPVDFGGAVRPIVIRLRVAGTTASTLKVLLNGAQIGATITVPASVTSQTTNLGVFLVAAGGNVQVETVTVGTGAAGLTVVVRIG